MDRLDYVKAAILNDREMYEIAELDAQTWYVMSPKQQEECIDDFFILYYSKVWNTFPWLKPTETEIKEGFRLSAEGIAADYTKIVFVKCGTAVVWHSLSGMYFVCDKDPDNCGKLRATHRTSDINLAEDYCYDRAGICNPVAEKDGYLYPASALTGEIVSEIPLTL